jgi:hypothetical protein
MKLAWYAETPARRSRQVVADVLALVGLVLCVWLGTTVHDTTEKLVEPGERIEAAGVEAVPADGRGASAVGNPSGRRRGRRAVQRRERGRSADRGRGQAAAGGRPHAGHGARLDGGGLPALLLCWPGCRDDCGSAAERPRARLLRESSAGIDLLALRALARQPIGALLRMKDAPVTGWRRQDPDVVAALAALELRRLGVQAAPVRRPPVAPGSH